MYLLPQEKRELFESSVDEVILFSYKVDDLDHVLNSSIREVVRAILEGKESVNINLKDFVSVDVLQRDVKDFFRECADSFFQEKISDVLEDMYPSKKTT